MTADEWIEELVNRHTRAMTRPEFLKAVRALSARYVEQRSTLKDRSPLDSAGKRAAFAAYYSPIHFLTIREIVRRLGAGDLQSRTITDLGCGTGVAGAAWALELAEPAAVAGIDINTWVLDEARWNWRALGLRGRNRRGDLVTALTELRPDPGVGLILGWSLNELEAGARAGAIDLILSLAERGAAILVVEPIATSAAPWWPAFADRAARVRGRIDEWKLDLPLPETLAELDEAAGFRRDSFGARSAAFGVC